ncbi:hypothetical protein Asp14428_53610 [Actinoplanes sp. NBRC 14428]|nr:hypothetical protein Asp14428_53610 [Actinoplanes sp. NBRC 14428]
MCGHAGAVGTLRPLRRLPSPERRPGAGRRPRQTARTTRDRAARGAYGGLPDGASGLAAPAATGVRARLSAHPKAARKLDEASARIYRTGRPSWDGRFDLVLLGAPVGRREAQQLSFLGYGMLDDRTWVAPRPADDTDTLLREAGVAYERFSAAHAGGSPGAVDVVGRAWDLAAIGQAYEEFVAIQRPVVTAINARSSDQDAYAARFHLVHAWRSFLFRDPQLPPSLLPPRWPGTTAASFFDRHAARLRPAADRFVERCLAAASRAGRVGFSEP